MSTTLREPLRISPDQLRSTAFSMAAVLVAAVVLASVVLLGVLGQTLAGGQLMGHTAADMAAIASNSSAADLWNALVTTSGGGMPRPTAPATHLVAGAGAISCALLALLSGLAAVRSLQRLHAALQVANRLQQQTGSDDSSLTVSTIALADLVQHASVTAVSVPAALKGLRAALIVGLLTAFFVADATIVGSGILSMVFGVALLLVAIAMLILAPLVLAAMWIGQLIRFIASRAQGRGQQTPRKSAAALWPAVTIQNATGEWYVDLAAPQFVQAFDPRVHQWQTETLRAIRTIHERLRQEKASKSDNPLKGIASGPLGKWGEKLGLDKVLFDPGKIPPRHITQDDVRLKVDKDHVSYTITITSSTGAQFPGETTFDSGGRLTLPEWTRVSAMRDSIAE